MVTKTQANKAKNDVVVETPITDTSKVKDAAAAPEGKAWGKGAEALEDLDEGHDDNGKKVDTGPTDGTVASNHNSLSAAEPLGLAQVKSMKDYNPQRREASRSNIQSDTSTVNADHNAALIDEKGERPSPHAPAADKGDADFDDNAMAAVEGADADLIEGNKKDDGTV